MSYEPKPNELKDEFMSVIAELAFNGAISNHECNILEAAFMKLYRAATRKFITPTAREIKKAVKPYIETLDNIALSGVLTDAEEDILNGSFEALHSIAMERAGETIEEI